MFMLIINDVHIPDEGAAGVEVVTAVDDGDREE